MNGNTASGWRSVVAGGRSNEAKGQSSTAAGGRGTIANDTGDGVLDEERERRREDLAERDDRIESLEPQNEIVCVFPRNVHTVDDTPE